MTSRETGSTGSRSGGLAEATLGTKDLAVLRQVESIHDTFLADICRDHVNLESSHNQSRIAATPSVSSDTTFRQNAACGEQEALITSIPSVLDYERMILIAVPPGASHRSGP